MSSLPEDLSAPPPALAAAWRADQPSPAELRRGYARFLRAQAPRRGVPALARWLLIGLILGAGLAQAATEVARRFGPFSAQSVRVHEPPRSKSAGKRLPAQQSPAAPAAPAAPSSDPTEAQTEPLPTASALGGLTTRAPAPSAASFAAGPVERQWQRIAAALRANDAISAESQLVELERATGGSERDAAQLARAQLLASQGRVSDALALARQLAQRSTSSVVRDKARELSTRLQQQLGADRSFPPAPAIHQP